MSLSGCVGTSRPIGQLDEILYPTVKVFYNSGTGSGVVIEERELEPGFKYLILTASHCVGPEGSECFIAAPGFIKDKQSSSFHDLRGTVIKKSKQDDLALIIIYSLIDICDPVTIAEEDLPIFNKVRVIGYPTGTGPLSSFGETSGFSKGKRCLNAPIYFGNSGGPVFSEDNRLIGIISAVLADGRTVIPHIGIYVPVSKINTFLEEFSKGTR